MFKKIREVIDSFRRKEYIPSISYEHFDFVQIIINGDDLNPGNIDEIILPHRDMNCFAMKGHFYGKEAIIYCTGAVKITARRVEGVNIGGDYEI